jgi:hypothetical protein
MNKLPYEKKKRVYGSRKHYSVIAKLEDEGRLNEQTQLYLNRLTLEEVIAVKLELASKASGGHIYGIPLWAGIVNIVRDAMLKFSLTAARTKAEAARFLGMNIENYNAYLKQYETERFFED